MGRRLWCRYGEIGSLIWLVRNHPDALNADLLRFGLRLRWLDDPGQDFTLGDALDVVEWATPDMAIFRALYPEEATWTLTNQLLASLLEFAQQKTWVEGGKKGPRPKPIPRPGVTEKSARKLTSEKTLSVTDMDAWLNSRRAG